MRADKAEQEVFSADVIVLQALGLFPRKSQDPSGPHGELLKPVPLILTECAKRLNEILFLLTQLLYLIVVILKGLLTASCALFTWCLHARLVVLALLLAALFSKHPKRFGSRFVPVDSQAFEATAVHTFSLAS